MRITRATGAHVPSAVELMARSPLLRRYGLTARTARASLAEALHARDIVLVALESGAVVGLAWVIVTRALDRAAYLRLLLVADGQQSRGVGAALLARAERQARAAGGRHLLLLVTATNRRARAFYVRQGYRYVASLPAFARPRITEALYVRKLR
jgi:GNAT superfamily N-acetyltransferase